MWHLAEILLAEPPHPDRVEYQCESCNVVFQAAGAASADTFELLPELMAKWDESTLSRIRGILTEYEANHPDCGYEYLSLLNGDNTSIPEMMGRPNG